MSVFLRAETMRIKVTERTILIDLKFLCYFQDYFGFVDNEADWLHIHLPFSLPPHFTNFTVFLLYFSLLMISFDEQFHNSPHNGPKMVFSSSCLSVSHLHGKQKTRLLLSSALLSDSIFFFFFCETKSEK